MLAAIFTGLFVSKFGPRAAVMLGTLITTAAYIVTSFVPNIHLFLITYGVVAAVATSFTFMGNIIPIYKYFDKHESKALSLVFTGYTIGFFMWPPLITILFRYYGWEGTFMILAGFVLQMGVFGALLRPFNDINDNSDPVKKNEGVCAHLMSQSRVFQNTYFLVHCVVCLLYGTSLPYMQSYLPTLAQGFGASDTQGALLVSIVGM